jgi:hypothetical protein
MLPSSPHAAREGRLGPRAEPIRPGLEPFGCREETSFGYRDGVFELSLLARAPEDRQIEAVRQGEAEFALVIEEPMALLCYRFGTAIPWSAVPVLDNKPILDVRPAGAAHCESRALLSTTLVEAARLTVLASRNVTLSLDFSRVLNEWIRDQARLPFDPREQSRALNRLRRRCPNDRALVAFATVRTLGSQ